MLFSININIIKENKSKLTHTGGIVFVSRKHNLAEIKSSRSDVYSFPSFFCYFDFIPAVWAIDNVRCRLLE